MSLLVAWLVPYATPLIAAYATPLIAAAFLLSYLLSFAWGGIWWVNQNTTGSVCRNQLNTSFSTFHEGDD